MRRNGLLTFQAHPGGRPTQVVLDVDGAGFGEVWLSAVEEAGRLH
jgi:hypothetical protein